MWFNYIDYLLFCNKKRKGNESSLFVIQEIFLNSFKCIYSILICLEKSNLKFFYLIQYTIIIVS